MTAPEDRTTCLPERRFQVICGSGCEMPELHRSVASKRQPPPPKLSSFVRQKTLKSAIHCSGVGLHTGSKVSMTLRPAEPNTGIRFRRTDAAGKGSEIQ